MTSWLPPHEIAATVPGFMDALNVIFTGHTAMGADMNALRMGVDGISQATPLDTFKTSLRAGHSVEQVMKSSIYSGVLAGAGLAVGQSGLPVGRCLPAATKSDPLAYSGELPGDAGRLFNARLGHLT